MVFYDLMTVFRNKNYLLEQSLKKKIEEMLLYIMLS